METIHISKLQRRGGNRKIFFLFLHENISSGYSLEEPPFSPMKRVMGTHQKCLSEALLMGTHNMFYWRNIKFLLENMPYLELCMFALQAFDFILKTLNQMDVKAGTINQIID